MNSREQMQALQEAERLIFTVEKHRRQQNNEFDKRIAQVCYLARCEIGKVEGECLIELGIRERKSYGAICADRPETPHSETTA